MLPRRHLAALLLSVAPACNDGGGQSSSFGTTPPVTTSTAGEPGTTDAPTTGLATGSTTSGSTTAATATTAATSTSTGDPGTGATTADPATSDPLPGSTGTTGGAIDPCGGDPGKTRLKGVVHTPKGNLPLYGVTVFVPGGPLDPVPEGVTCDTCVGGPSGDPIVATLTGTDGAFTLEGVPAGADVPLVISVGKWRREIVIPEVVACADNVAPDELTRLPRNQSEGHIPQIAVTTGKADTLECLLRKVGLDDAEFTDFDGPGRVHLFAGATGSAAFAPELNGGAAFPPASELWEHPDVLARYDIVLMSCEGQQYGDQKTAQARQNILDYAGLGGRLFFSHWHNVWIEGGPAPWPSTATFTHLDYLEQSLTATIAAGFPKGKALAEWMLHVGGSQKLGEVKLTWIKNTVTAVDLALSTRWVHTKSPARVQYFSFNAPVGLPADQQCGRVVNSDIHVVSGNVLIDDPFPASCVSKGLSPQEKLIVFMLFDISACLQPDSEDPIPG